MEPTVGRVAGASGRRDVDLVRRARAGDVAAFEAVAAARVDASFRLASAILGPGADAAEATQAALVAAWRELPRLRRPEAFDGWLLRTLVNECRMRARQLAQAHVADQAPAPAAGATPAAGEAPGGDEALGRDEAIDLLERAFEALDADDRALLVLHDLEEQPLAEIAASLHLPAGTARWRLHEARGAMLAALEPRP
jgi:RNA polymerase sigma-70 factor, ECF subfamily